MFDFLQNGVDVLEVWKEVEGYEGLYEVSNLGKVRSLLRHKILSPKVNCRTGYVEVNLYGKGTPKTIAVHKLVAIAFIPCNDSQLEVNHIDENKLNNTVENLEWCDRHYNTHYGTRNERLKQHLRKRCAKITPKDVEKIKLLRDNKTVKEIAHMFGISDSQVYRIINGVNWRDVL